MKMYFPRYNLTDILQVFLRLQNVGILSKPRICFQDKLLLFPYNGHSEAGLGLIILKFALEYTTEEMWASHRTMSDPKSRPNIMLAQGSSSLLLNFNIRIKIASL